MKIILAIVVVVAIFGIYGFNRILAGSQPYRYPLNNPWIIQPDQPYQNPPMMGPWMRGGYPGSSPNTGQLPRRSYQYYSDWCW